MDIPKSCPFRELANRLKSLSIYWEKGRGKGSHGCFVGPDANGKIQAYPIPKSNQKDVCRSYLKGLCQRFGIDTSSFFSD